MADPVARCAVCGKEVNQPLAPELLPAEPPDFDTRPGEPVRSTISNWVFCCPSCGYCASDVTTAFEPAAAIVGSGEYQAILRDTSLPEKVREFLAYSEILARIQQLADAGWTALHAAWWCDDAGYPQPATLCRGRALEFWKHGKHHGQSFGDDLPHEYAIVTDIYRRCGEFEKAIATCSEALDMEDLPPIIDSMLRRQKTYIERKDTERHSLSEILYPS